MDRLLVDVPGAVSLSAGADFDADPSVTVVDGAGVSVSTGTGSNVAGLGEYEYTFTPDALDVLTVTWAGNIGGDAASFTSQVAVVGGTPLTVAEVRAADEDLADVVKYPTDVVQRAIYEAWDQAERSMRVALVPAGSRVTARSDGSAQVLLAERALRRVVAVTVDGVAVDVSASPSEAGVLYLDGAPTVGAEIAVHYEHGWDSPPAQVRRALRLLAIEYLVPSAMPGRATSLSTDVGAFRLTVAGRDGDTGLPDVDAVFAQFGYATRGGFG